MKSWICTLNVIIWRVFSPDFHTKVFLFSASETSDKETSNDDESSTTSKEIDRISTLTQSLATLTSEKSRLEQSFQEDKKKVRAEIKEKNKTIESFLVELKEVKEKSRVETEEAKSKLIIERHNRYVCKLSIFYQSLIFFINLFGPGLMWKVFNSLKELNCRKNSTAKIGI